jgi:hypothetical protein
MKKLVLLISSFFLGANIFAQSGIVNGIVLDAIERTGLPYATITVDDEAKIYNSDSLGKFSLNLKAGFHKLKISFISYEAVILHQVKVDPVKPLDLVVELRTSENALEEIVLKGAGVSRTMETPLSVKSIGINEINRLPGTTLDVSKVLKTLPGVLPKVSFGYNIIVRGGASHENKFFMDGIEIPSINHFSVQGVSGGPNGLINVDILRGANLITAAFPANRYNALSSVLDLNTRQGRSDRLGGKFTLGATDAGLTLEGPLSQNSNFIASFRKSFSEYYLKAFKLPVLPAYSDYNLKFESRWKRNELKIIAVGGFDQSRLNLDDAEKPDASEALQYNTGYIPEGDQSVHTIGMNYKKYSDIGFTNVILSTSYFRNQAVKYFDNTFEAEDLWYDYDASELATRMRFEQTIYNGENSLKFGVSAENKNISLDNYSLDIGPDINPFLNDFESRLTTFEYGAFLSYNRNLLNERLNVFAGLRVDASTYGELTSNPFDQISPRISLNYELNEKMDLSASVGSYYQLPPSVILAFSDDNQLVNQNRVGYINSQQAAIGYSYQISEDRLFSVEAFYKTYSDYPFLLRDSISFANANADYVVVGNQPAESTSVGRAYGLELFAQKKFKGNNLWSAAYNWSKSEFQDKNGEYISSSWDTRHFLSLIYARTFGNNWQWGTKFTYASSSPYTPFDVEKSSQVAFWDLNRRGVFDYSRLNSQSLKPFHQLDFRIDKNIYSKKFTTNLYIDIQNIYSSAIEFIPYLVPVRDENGAFLLDPDDPSRYQTEIINSDTGRVLPTIGVIIEL